jgi:sugar phosphate isomerase/epimerase
MIDPEPKADLSLCCVHTITTKPWSLREAAENYAAAGIRGITVWRDVLEGAPVTESRAIIESCGLETVALCRGGFFPGIDAASRQTAIDDNRRAIDEAAELGAPMVVLVCGAHPGQPLTGSRQQIRDGIEAVLPHAAGCGVKLAIEPLHPMYADDRSAINTLSQANAMAEAIDSPYVGVAVDVYHLWWDPDLEAGIRRCGAHGNLLAFHVCDWKTPTTDLLLDRGLMGEGCIDIPRIRNWVESAGFDGFIEVEIFSTIYWESEQAGFLEKIKHSYLTCV